MDNNTGLTDPGEASNHWQYQRLAGVNKNEEASLLLVKHDSPVSIIQLVSHASAVWL